MFSFYQNLLVTKTFSIKTTSYEEKNSIRKRSRHSNRSSVMFSAFLQQWSNAGFMKGKTQWYRSVYWQFKHSRKILKISKRKKVKHGHFMRNKISAFFVLAISETNMVVKTRNILAHQRSYIMLIKQQNYCKNNTDFEIRLNIFDNQTKMMCMLFLKSLVTWKLVFVIRRNVSNYDKHCQCYIVFNVSITPVILNAYFQN